MKWTLITADQQFGAKSWCAHAHEMRSHTFIKSVHTFFGWHMGEHIHVWYSSNVKAANMKLMCPTQWWTPTHTIWCLSSLQAVNFFFFHLCPISLGDLSSVELSSLNFWSDLKANIFWKLLIISIAFSIKRTNVSKSFKKIYICIFKFRACTLSTAGAVVNKYKQTKK